MCNEAVSNYCWVVNSVPDWFVTLNIIKKWRDNCHYAVNDKDVITWSCDYKKRKALKKKY